MDRERNFSKQGKLWKMLKSHANEMTMFGILQTLILDSKVILIDSVYFRFWNPLTLQ